MCPSHQLETVVISKVIKPDAFLDFKRCKATGNYAFDINISIDLVNELT